MKLSPSAQKIQNVLQQIGINLQVVELPTSTRTAQDAAQSIGCDIGQIAKSLVFKTKDSLKPVLVIASGNNRVDESKLTSILKEPITKADPEFVRNVTGFAIGGIPPIGHATAMDILIDEDLLTYEKIWAAAGTPNGVFQLTPKELETITKGKVCSIKDSHS